VCDFLFFSLGFMFAYLLSSLGVLLSNGWRTWAVTGAGIFGLFNDMGLYFGCACQVFVLLLRCQSWFVLDFAAISGVYL